MNIAFTWSESKRASNLKTHELDFSEAELVFKGLNFTVRDSRFAYPEIRFTTLCLLHGLNVTIVHTESDYEIRIISFRKATRAEARIYFEAIGN
jgi:uncharacterized DUF497 family protein